MILIVIFRLKVVRGTKFTKRYFKNLVQARSDNLTVSIFDTLEDMEKYSEKSVSNVYYLLLEGVGVRNVNADHAASHLGKAQGLVQQLRQVLNLKWETKLIATPLFVVRCN